jgi:hypothetical protein
MMLRRLSIPAALLLMAVTSVPADGQLYALQAEMTRLEPGVFGGQFELLTGAGNHLVLEVPLSSADTAVYYELREESTGRLLASGLFDPARSPKLSVDSLPGKTLLTIVGPAPRFNATYRATNPSVRYVQFSDPIGDNAQASAPLPLGYPTPDIERIEAIVWEGNATFIIHMAPQSFDPEWTRVSACIDIDENPETGHRRPGYSSGCDYTVGGRPGRPIIMQSHQGDNWQYLSGDIQIEFNSNATVAIQVPLSLLGNDDGRFRFHAAATVALNENTGTGVMDVSPQTYFSGGWIQVP